MAHSHVAFTWKFKFVKLPDPLRAKRAFGRPLVWTNSLSFLDVPYPIKLLSMSRRCLISVLHTLDMWNICCTHGLYWLHSLTPATASTVYCLTSERRDVLTRYPTFDVHAAYWCEYGGLFDPET